MATAKKVLKKANTVKKKAAKAAKPTTYQICEEVREQK
jgi:hypothetical protein